MKFFSMDSPLGKILANVFDLMLVNVLFIVCSLPIVTLGASLTAMNFVSLQMVEGKQPNVFQEFFKSFKQNFKQATILWGLVFAMSAVFFAWYIVIENMVAINIAAFLRVILYIVIALFAMISLYVFYLLAKFENNIVGILKNALLMSIKHFMTTLLSFLLLLLVILVVMFYPKWVGYGLFLVVIGFSLVSYLISLMMARVFERYI